eukprot:m.343806 g.343806  ORF g.343806 m.343806 type:complete len:812 (+) comp23346_c0_seq1:93-2528(+)
MELRLLMPLLLAVTKCSETSAKKQCVVDVYLSSAYNKVEFESNNNNNYHCVKVPSWNEAHRIARTYSNSCQRSIIIGQQLLDTVNVRVKTKETVQVDATVVLEGPKDSNITVRSAYGVQGTLSGGIALQGSWVAPEGSGSGIWKLQLQAQSKTGTCDTQFNQLFVNGSRATRARHPNTGSFSVISAPLNGTEASSGFVYNQSDFPAVAIAAGIEDVNIVVYASWQASRRKLRAVYPNNSTLYFETPASVQFSYANTGRRYYTENFVQAVDEPGEWFLDKKSCTLFYYFEPTGDITHPNQLGDFMVPVVSGDLLRMENIFGATVSDITVEFADWGITDSEWNRVAEHSGTVQAASFLNTSCVHVTDNSSFVTFNNVVIRHSGEYGLWVHGGSSNISVMNSTIYDVGAGGIRIGVGKPLVDTPDGTESVMIVDTVVAHGSNVFHEGNGILLQKSSYNTISHCEVAFFSHCGISVGWTWDYRPSEAHNNLIEYNHVHDIGNGDLSDFGGIYLLGISHGTVVQYNNVHDAYPFFKYGHGIYLDQASSDIDVKMNVVHHTEASNFLLHYGVNNTIHNNIFAYATGGYGSVWQNSDPGQPTTGVDRRTSSLDFTHNIVYLDDVGPSDPSDGLGASNWPLFATPYRGNNSFDFNCYYNASSNGVLTATFPSWIADDSYSRYNANRSLLEWQKVGQDVHSIVTNPLFANATYCNFSLLSASPMLQVPGYIDFNINTVGPRSSNHIWKTKCIKSNGEEVKSCGSPPIPANGGVSHRSNYNCGATIRVFCNSGYSQYGPMSRTCTASGWTGGDVTCVTEAE